MDMKRNNTQRPPSEASNSNRRIDLNSEAIQSHLKDDGHHISSHRRWNKDSGNNGDASRWLRPLGVIFAIIFMALVILNSLSSLISTSIKPTILHSGVDDTAIGRNMLVIQLSPKDHVFRQPKTITHHWNITSGIRYPDGVKKEVYLVNELFPGPTIECRSEDKLVIHVTNSLPSEETSFHWHGLEMRGSNNMDGAVGLTQCPIPSGRSFTYEFVVSEENFGTFWWHAHSQVQRGDGMYGGLVVHKPARIGNDMSDYGYEEDGLVMFGDWYHRSAEEVLAWYTSARGFGNEPVPDSLLVNGAGRFSCSMAVPARPLDCVDTPEEQMPTLFGSKHKPVSTRLRLVNVGSLAGLTVEMSSATLTPLTVDGGYRIVGRGSNSVGIIYPGERVDLLVQWDGKSKPQSSKLNIYIDPENFKYPNQALRQNQTFPVFDSDTGAINDPPRHIPSTHFDLSKAQSAPYPEKFPATAHQTILLYAKTEKLSISNNHPTGFMNRTTWSPQSNPSLPLISLPRSQWDDNQLIPHIPISPFPEIWVDIIINNLDDGAHPFHLHGYSFYVLASHRSEHGWGSYSPYSNTASSRSPVLNLESPLRKDTVSVPRRGYVIIRFKADSVGIWMLHCHVLFHQASGMVMGFQVGGDEDHEIVDTTSLSLCSIQN
ncbi:multicopper oxidase family protein [Rhexocercosporidium sp. MPI-PUGE-AT-0058]|nr:multicopper oxidase family protein [Rhexocercosporidium sp. MPI-PUGE-AT-0058]